MAQQQLQQAMMATRQELDQVRAQLQGVADENGYENLSPKAKLPSYSNLFGMA